MEITVIFWYPNIKLSQHESKFHKWALGSITENKLLEVLEFQLSYFKS